MIKPLLVKLFNGALGPATRLAEAALRRARGLPPGAPVRMTSSQLAWDAYLRRRDGACPRDFARLRAPGAPGLVSIVLPVHNGQRYLPEALDSILAQSWRDFELIVIDDGSTDATPEIIARYAARDARIRAVRQANARLPGALNAGFALARGELLTWTSDDNRLRPDFLEKMAGALAADPSADMIYADYDLIDDAGAPLRDSAVCARIQEPPGSGRVRLPRDISFLNLINGNFVGGAFMYRARAALLIGPYSPRRFTCEDYDYWLRINEQLSLRHAPFRDIVYEYRIHGASLSARKDDLAIDRRTAELIAFDDFRRDLASHPILWDIRLDGGADGSALGMARDLRERLKRAGHVESDPTAIRLTTHNSQLTTHSAFGGEADEDVRAPSDSAFRIPHSAFVPAARVFITSDLRHSAPPPEARALPPGAPRILVYTGAARPLPPQVDPGWNLCIAISDIENLPALGGRGWLAAADFDMLWSALLVRVQSVYAERCERAAETPATLRASIVICTRRRPRTLEAALRAACAQSLNPEQYEVLVVNNDPADDLTDLIDRVRAELRPGASETLRLVECPLPGLSIARNAGLGEARGEVVVFIDDDAIAAPDMLENLLKPYAAHPDCAAIGGSIILQDPDPAPSWFAPAARKYWSHLEPADSNFKLVDDWREFPWGACWSARREALLAIGGFRHRYGRGGELGTGEEIVAAMLLKRLGYRIGLAPAARVTHAVDPARFTLVSLAHTIFDTFCLSLPLELDFYIERPAHWPRLLWQSLKHLRHGFYALRKSRFEAIESFLFAAAHVRLALMQIRVELHRWRRPRQERG